jgi:hypothetical protein
MLTSRIFIYPIIAVRYPKSAADRDGIAGNVRMKSLADLASSGFVEAPGDVIAWVRGSRLRIGETEFRVV